jgi:phage shock protein E
MISFLKNLLGGNRANLVAIIESGARIIDVRSPAEFHSGHVAGSENIPLDVIEKKIGTANKEEIIVLCCRSGTRSGMAAGKLRQMGFRNVHNGGSWTSLKSLILKK